MKHCCPLLSDPDNSPLGLYLSFVYVVAPADEKWKTVVVEWRWLVCSRLLQHKKLLWWNFSASSRQSDTMYSGRGVYLCKQVALCRSWSWHSQTGEDGEYIFDDVAFFFGFFVPLWWWMWTSETWPSSHKCQQFYLHKTATVSFYCLRIPVKKVLNKDEKNLFERSLKWHTW